MDTLAEYWDSIVDVGGLRVALPGEPEQLELGAEPLFVADEFGDAFGVLLGSDDQLALALARALDQIYGVEWGTAATPTIDATRSSAAFEGFATRYLALWRRHGSQALLFAVVRPEREARARSFVDGASLRE
ncbi:MAG TPA: hypothetical protein VK034_18820 [Enhygromyxa sp.]|nr:hypothetical protein [Enhygromyxa sp.]